jgi:tetratricopeptide (TPR) repeat protein
VKAHPDDLQARFYAAWSAAFLGRTYEAADLLTGMDESNPGVQFLWGKLLLDKRDPQGAIETLAPLVGRAHASLELEVRRLLAKAYMEQGRADLAVDLLEGRAGEDASVALDLAMARYENGQLEEALTGVGPYATRALERAQNGEPATGLSISLIYEYGRMLVTSGRHSEAIPFLEWAVRSHKACKQCWQHLAQAHAAEGNKPEARAAQRKFEQIRQTEISSEEAQRQQAEDQRDPTGKVVRQARRLFEEGRADEALVMLRAEGQLRPEDPRTLHLAALILTETGRAADALGLAEQAVQIAPDSAESFYVRGTVRRELGEVNGARKDYERALELTPEHAQASSALAELSPS